MYKYMYFLFLISSLIGDSYRDNGNGTVTDTTTKLVWQKCQVGLYGEDCSSGNQFQQFNWEDSVSYCKDLKFAGLVWRLPERNELSSLLVYGSKDVPVIDSKYFPNTSDYSFFSKTTYAFVKDEAWSINFSDGYITREPKEQTKYLRCVSGNQRSPSFSRNKDGTLKDTTSSLIWQKCSVGQSGVNCSKGKSHLFTWQEALNFCEGYKMGNKSWRVPGIKELETLVDLKKETSPTIHEGFFPNTESVMESRADGYWSSTSEKYGEGAYFLSFFLGSISSKTKTEKSSYVRCVTDL